MSLETMLDTTHDQHAFRQVSAAIQRHNALALVGAGMSARAGYPSWNALLSKMADRLEAHVRQVAELGGEALTRPLPAELRDHPDVLWRAEAVRDLLTEPPYLAFLREQFGDQEPKPDACMDALMRLPFRHVLTTNYDRALEITHERVHGRPIASINWSNDDESVRRLLYSLLTPESPRQLVYLHGRVSEPESIILSDRDYTRQYLRSDATVRRLFALFAMQRVVFVGFSLDDPDLVAILRQVTGALGYEEARHFAFLGVKPGAPRETDRKRLRNKFGVEAIFYDSSDGHRMLERLMRALVAECGGEDVVMPDFALAPAAAPQASAPTMLTAPSPAPVMPPPVAAAPAAPIAALGVEDADRRNARMPDDPRKGMFGGRANANGRELSASVSRVDGRDDWFQVELTVAVSDAGAPLAGPVRFYLHPTFPLPVIEVAPVGARASLVLTSYGAFTVGVIADGATTELELDLAALEGIPARFRDS